MLTKDVTITNFQFVRRCVFFFLAEDKSAEKIFISNATIDRIKREGGDRRGKSSTGLSRIIKCKISVWLICTSGDWRGEEK